MSSTIPEDEQAIVLRRRAGDPAIVSSKHCPFGCYDLCHRPEICQKLPADRTAADVAEIAAFQRDVETAAETDLRAREDEEGRREPVAAERQAYQKLWATVIS